MNDNFNATNSASVFFCSDGSVPFPSTVPEERAKELSSIGNATVKREKEAVWGLLIAAIGSLGTNPDDVTFGRTENGKWFCDKFFFSLSHSHGAVAVAISDNPCGIDIEKRSELCVNAQIRRFAINCKEKSRQPIRRLKPSLRRGQPKRPNISVSAAVFLPPEYLLTKQRYDISKSAIFFCVCHVIIRRRFGYGFSPTDGFPKTI